MSIIDNKYKNKLTFYENINSQLIKAKRLVKFIDTEDDNNYMIHETLNKLIDMIENMKQKIKSLEISIFELKKNK